MNAQTHRAAVVDINEIRELAQALLVNLGGIVDGLTAEPDCTPVWSRNECSAGANNARKISERLKLLHGLLPESDA